MRIDAGAGWSPSRGASSGWRHLARDVRLPRIIGHRGVAARAPENTLAGCRKPAELGLEWVEFDVRLTADGRPVVIHDAALDRTTDGRGPVAEASFEAVRALDAGCVTCQVDVTNSADLERMMEEARQRYGGVDVLVNNAGVTDDGLVLRMSEESWRTVLDTNLTGTFQATKLALRHMSRARWGRIINITSVVGVVGNAGQANYAASKAGLIGFTKSIAKELASRGVRCNAIAPGFINTDMTAQLPEATVEELHARIPLGHLGEPSDVAGLVRFLAGPAARYITGQVISVDGGMVM